MRTDRRAFLSLLFASALLFGPAAFGQSAARRHETVAFESKLVGAALPYHVVLPADYHAESSKQTRYPVLFLLHGLGGSANDWVSERARLAEHAAAHRLIVVVPEGRDNWYTDSATAPREKFESYFIEELLPDVGRRFRTAAGREGRAVAGLSMGGYGALKFGFKHPEKFALAASMSGALGAASWVPTESLPAFVRPSLARVYGPAGSPTRAANDLFRLAREAAPERVAALPYLYLDCGTEDFLIANNRDFSALLLERKIPHEYRQLPGRHDWPYWDRQVREVLKLASERLAAPAAARGASAAPPR
ncbi:MAG TPA: alpha/beta hydrolase family protein [Pyrinomonadaceae bacterium]|nr:alpha/beta hydrolase family protein [Pyrinomonadaceae bacterium]